MVNVNGDSSHAYPINPHGRISLRTVSIYATVKLLGRVGRYSFDCKGQTSKRDNEESGISEQKSEQFRGYSFSIGVPQSIIVPNNPHRP